jgi:hypothetical protein
MPASSAVGVIMCYFGIGIDNFPLAIGGERRERDLLRFPLVSKSNRGRYVNPCVRSWSQQFVGLTRDFIVQRGNLFPTRLLSTSVGGSRLKHTCIL